jgi:hypothetical protein
MRLEAGGRRQEAGGRRLEAGGWWLEVGGWRLVVGGLLIHCLEHRFVPASQPETSVRGADTRTRRRSPDLAANCDRQVSGIPTNRARHRSPDLAANCNRRVSGIPTRARRRSPDLAANCDRQVRALRARRRSPDLAAYSDRQVRALRARRRSPDLAANCDRQVRALRARRRSPDLAAYSDRQVRALRARRRSPDLAVPALGAGLPTSPLIATVRSPVFRLTRYRYWHSDLGSRLSFFYQALTYQPESTIGTTTEVCSIRASGVGQLKRRPSVATRAGSETLAQRALTVG